LNYQGKPVLSPSSYIRFSACNKTLTLRSEYPGIRVKTPQKALLGQIAHKVLERASKLMHQNLNLGNINSEFNELWNQIEKEYFDRYVTEWTPNPVPPITSWRSYFKIKMAAKGIMKAQLSGSKNATPTLLHSDHSMRTLLEEYVKDDELAIEGYIDRLVIFPDGIYIYDYKFGQSDLDSPEYKIQLGFYSILASRKFKLPVRKTSIIIGEGIEHAVEIQDSFLMDLQSDITEAQKTILENRANAKPSIKNCKFCSFKPVCEDFKLSGITLDNGIPLVVNGEILSIAKLGGEFATLTILDEASYNAVQVSKVPSGFNFQEGQEVHISGPMQFFTQTVVEAKPNTIFWRSS